MFFTDSNSNDHETQPSASRRTMVAQRVARTVPWIMGTLSAGLREQGESLHPSQLKILMAMHHAPCAPSDLAQRMEVSMPTVSKTLDVLERRGLVERTPDPTDRRRVQLKMTDEGRAVLRRVLDRGIAQLSGLLEEATPEELDHIEAGMTALSTVLERVHPGHTGRCDRHSATEGGDRR